MKIGQDSVAIITGGASGIGFGIARAIAGEGAKVVLADIDGDAAGRAANSLAAEGHTAIAVELDVGNEAEWQRILGDVQSRLGEVHILCNNAGVTGALDTPLHQVTSREWEWVRAVNLEGVLNGVRTLVPHMLGHGAPAHLVNTGSMASLAIFAGTGDYSATKQAVGGLTGVLREDLKDTNIGVSLLCPGVVRTDMLAISRQLRREALGQQCTAPETNAHYEETIAAGMEPILVGRLVVAAIAENRSYIFNNPDFRPVVEQRFSAIADDFAWAEQALGRLSA